MPRIQYDIPRFAKDLNRSFASHVWSCSQDVFRAAWNEVSGTVLGSIDCASQPVECRNRAVEAIRSSYSFMMNLSTEVRQIVDSLSGLSEEEARGMACELAGSLAPGVIVGIMTAGSGSTLALQRARELAQRLSQIKDLLGLRVRVAVSGLLGLPDRVVRSIRKLIRDGRSDYVGGVLIDCLGDAAPASRQSRAKLFRSRSCDIPSLEKRLGDIKLMRGLAMREALDAQALSDRDRVGLRRVKMSDKNGRCIPLTPNCDQFVKTREYFYQKINSSTGRRETFVLQQHTMGHVLGDSKQTSYEPPHFNLRRCHPDVGTQVHNQNTIKDLPVRDACKEGVKRPGTNEEHFYAISKQDHETWSKNHTRYLPNPAWTNKCDQKCN